MLYPYSQHVLMIVLEYGCGMYGLSMLGSRSTDNFFFALHEAHKHTRSKDHSTMAAMLIRFVRDSQHIALISNDFFTFVDRVDSN